VPTVPIPCRPFHKSDHRPPTIRFLLLSNQALPDRWAELDRLADLRVRFLDETGGFFDAKPDFTTAYRDAAPSTRRPPALSVSIGSESERKLTPHVSVLAEFERALIVERTRAGLMAAKRRGVKPAASRPSLPCR
jgi:Resolvase, N terminal domain